MDPSADTDFDASRYIIEPGRPPDRASRALMYNAPPMFTALARSSILACTAVAQLLGMLYVTFGGLVAFEMSALLGVCR